MKITASNYMGREQNPFGDKEPPTNWTRGDAAIMAGAEEQGQIVQMQITHSSWEDFERTVQTYPVFNSKGKAVKEFNGEAELVWQFKIPAIELWRTVEKVTYDRFVNFDDYEKHYNERDLQCRQIFIITESEKISEPGESKWNEKTQSGRYRRPVHHGEVVRRQLEKSEPEPGDETIDEKLEKLWLKADEIILTEVEWLARNVLALNPKTKEFINAMGSFFFTHKTNKDYNFSTMDEIITLKGGKELWDFVARHDERFKITGEPMRFTATGEIIKNW